VSLYGYLFLRRDSSILYVFLLLMLTGTGMANIVAPSTESVMSTLPREVAGVGSAVNNTTRQVSGALGIAVFGSLIQIVYASRIGDALNVLPPGVRGEASHSLGDTYVTTSRLARADPEAAKAALQKLGCGAGQLCQAGDAFLSGVHIVAFVAGTVALIGVGVALRWLPRYSLANGGGRPTGPVVDGRYDAEAAVAPTASERP